LGKVWKEAIVICKVLVELSRNTNNFTQNIRYLNRDSNLGPPEY